MSAPTIAEMLVLIDSAIFNCTPADGVRMRSAIRAILEQHRESEVEEIPPLLTATVRDFRLRTIRAFVERVEKSLPNYDTGRGADEWLKHYHRAVKDELAAMEKEAEQ